MSAYFLFGTFRNLWRNKLNSLINIASLCIGLAVFSFAFLYVKVETSFDRAWPDANQLHRLLIDQQGIPGQEEAVYDNARAQVYPAILENFAEVIERSSRVYNFGTRLSEPDGNFVFVTFVEPAFTEIFQHEVVSGSIERALSGPGFIAVEEEYARNMGWTQGGSVTLVSQSAPQGTEPGEVVYEVATIYRIPRNVSPVTRFPVLSLMHEYARPLYATVLMGGTPGEAPWANSNRIWLKLKPGVDVDAINAAMPRIVESTVTNFNSLLAPGTRISDYIEWHLQPVTEIHFNPGTIETATAGDRGKVLTIAAIGVLVLLAGCSNAVSLSLAAVLERRREIGIRKAVGALPADIRRQYLAESALQALLALIPALLLVEVLLEPFTVLLAIRGVLDFGPVDYAVLTLIAAAVGLLSGAWPALVMSRVKPQMVLKAGSGGTGKETLRLRSLLVGGQYCFALLLMIGTLALFAQLQVLRTQPLGFDPTDVLYLRYGSQTEIDRAAGLDAELRKLPGIEFLVPVNVPPNQNLPLGVWNYGQMVNRQQNVVEASVSQMVASTGYFDLLQIPLLAGRFFDDARDNMFAQAESTSGAVPATRPEAKTLLNRSAVRVLEFENPEAAIDQVVYLRTSDRDGRVRESPYRVIGVVEDNMYSSLHRRPGPEYYTYVPHDRLRTPQFLLRISDGADVNQVQDDLKRAWQEVTGAPLQSINYLEDRLALAFETERNESRLLLYCATLALLLSSIGLYGLAAYSMERNIKEVGVRKALGASVTGLAGLYLWRYARPVLLAALVACPLAAYSVLQWLQRFPYQLEAYWLLPVSVAGVMTVLAIALLTVLGLVLKAARSRPVQALRYE